MPDYSELKQNLTTLESLERELNLKQLQINRLLNITQAINNNVSADGLFNMYKSFLSWEIGIKKMALYFKEDEEWPCAASIGIAEELLKMDIRDTLPRYTRLNNLEATEHPLLKQFEVVIPVRHKDDPIAYVFIGGFEADDDMYSKVQFITAITNVIAVAIENKRLFKRQLEQEGFKREMELAGEIQQLLIPKKLPSTEAYELSSIYKPQLGIGGDYFDFVEFDNGKIVFAIGDVSGKGIGAALLMANFQANFQTLINKRSSLEDFVRALNQSVHQITKGDRFITFFVAEYEVGSGYIRYINAGHNPPILVSDGKMSLLTQGCTLLGPFETLPFLELGTATIGEEAIILSYTDGLTDLINDAGENFDEQYLFQLARENYQLSANAFSSRLMQEIRQFKGQQAYPDDITILTCKMYNKPLSSL